MPEIMLTDEQQVILRHDLRRHARIIAGPGTGKSATLVALVQQLLGEAPAPRVKLLTFTRAATSELARKVAEVPASIAERPSTIHSFSISVLLRNPGAGDFPKSLRIVDDWEYDTTIRPGLARRARVRIRRLNVLVTEMAANWQSLRPEHNPRITPEERGRFLQAWNEHRQIYGYTLLDELPHALRGALRDYEDLQGVDFDLLIVDEYQDLNACDLEVLGLIAARGCSIIAAGDDDQSIYSFRKAAPEGILRFDEDYPGAVDYTLTITQRCGRTIVEWATYVIQGDPDRPRKPPLIPTVGAPTGEVALLSFNGERAEARGVAAIVQRLINREEVPPGEILILLRSDHDAHFSTPIRQELGRLGIPVSDPDNVDRVLAEPTNRRLLEILRLMVNRQDSIAWASLLHLEGGIGSTFFDYVYHHALAQRRQFGQILLDLRQAGFPDSPTSARRAAALIDTLSAWFEAHAAPAEEPEGGWARWVIETSRDNVLPSPSPKLREMLLVVEEMAEPGETLGRFLGQLRPIARDRALATSDGVRIMRMPGAKGLTARAVVIAAVEDGLVPRPEGELAEERRLLYVSMTRAQQFLYCTWATQRRGPTARSGAPRVAPELRHHSQFLDGGPVESQNGARYVARRWA